MKRSLSMACLAAIALIASPCRADEMADDFAWFSTLGFQDVKGLQFVRYVWTWSDNGEGGKMQPVWNNAFLLEETPEKFRVLTMNFQIREIPKTSTQKNTVEVKSLVEPQDLKAYLESRLAPDPKHPNDRPHLWLGGEMGLPVIEEERTVAFVMAWDCSRQGLDDEAAKLYAEAQKRSVLYSGDQTTSFRQKLQRDLGIYELWGILLDFNNLAFTRPQLLEKLEHFQESFPDTTFPGDAREMIAILKTMIADDDAHPKLTEEQIAKLPPADQAKEWVFRLRDDAGFGQIGLGDAGDHLVALEDAAVPAMMDALDDKSYTRSLEERSSFGGPRAVVTVGAAAWRVLGRMANRNFRNKDSLDLWWKTRQEKGEAGELAETVARGDEDSAGAGYLLVKKYPDQASEPILAGIKAAKNPYISGELVQLAKTLKKNPVKESMLAEMTKEGHPIMERLQAAFTLAGMGNNDAIPALAAVWRKSNFPDDPEQDEENERDGLIGLLAAADTPVGVEALGNGLMKRSAEMRSTVLQAFGFGDMDDTVFSGPGPHGKRSPATQAAVEALLAAELEDTRAHTGFTGSEGDVQLPADLRLCDYAAYLMSIHWPDRYKFTTTASLAEREKQRLVCLNTWRKSQGLKPEEPAVSHSGQ